MTTYTVSSEFPAGTAGTVTFERFEPLVSTVEGFIPPAAGAQAVVATIAGSPPAISQALRPTSETGVSPDFRYKVTISFDGQNDIVGFMELTEDSQLSEIFNWTTPPQPDIFVTKAEFETLSDALGDPVSRTEFTALSDDVDTLTAGLASEVTNRANDVDAEQARAEGVEAGHETRLDAEEALSTAFAAAIDALEALGIPTPVGAADGKVIKVLDDAYVLGDDNTGGGGGGGGVLDQAYYLPGGASNIQSSSLTYVDLDATNIQVSFTVPASGSVYVQIEVRGYGVVGDTALWFAMRKVSDNTVMGNPVAATAISDADTNRCTCAIRVDGLTPSATETWKASIRSAYNGSGTVGARFGNGDPAVVTVFELP